MYFPNFIFVKFITDKKGNKYYYSRSKSSTDLFIIKYNEERRTKFKRFFYVIGGLGEEGWEFIGEIK